MGNKTTLSCKVFATTCELFIIFKLLNQLYKMKALFITILVMVLIPYTLYRIYIGYLILNKKTKYNKSSKIGDWYINGNPITRLLMFGTFKNVKVEGYKYKILNKEEEIAENENKKSL